MEETLREIKKRFRMAMNGIVSTSMREKGMGYRINFGLTLPLIRNIAESYTPNAELAQYLWKEQIRESKMLATWLYPANEMNPDKAQQWAEEIPYPEIADICCMNLFIKLPFAIQKASEWVTSDKDILRYTGYQLFNRLMMQNRYPDKTVEESLKPRRPGNLLNTNSGTQLHKTADAQRPSNSKTYSRHISPYIRNRK